MGSAAGAVDELETALRLGAKSARNYTDLGVALAAAGRPGEAANAYRNAIQMDNEFYEAHLALGQILMKQGDLRDAHMHLEKAAESPDPRVREAAQKIR
jgi:Flp pilus assembly protein TadD